MSFNQALAEHLLQIGAMFNTKKEEWKARAFFKAGATIKKMEEEIPFVNGELAVKIPGAGKAINDVINEFKATGTSRKYDRLAVEAPDLPIDERMPAAPAKQAVERLFADLEGIDWGFAGSMRRGLPTVKDIDVVVCLENESQKSELADYLAQRSVTPDVRSGDKKWGMTIAVGDKTIVLDLNFCTPENRGAYYLYFTGPKQFGITLRSIAKGKGLKVNEYGIFDSNECLASKTEEGVLAVLSIPYIEPENRETYF